MGEMSDLLEEFYDDQLRVQRKATREKIKKARIQGERKGEKKGLNKLSSLYSKLYKEKRSEDIKGINEDYEYRDKLLEEMFPQENKEECPA